MSDLPELETASHSSLPSLMRRRLMQAAGGFLIAAVVDGTPRFLWPGEARAADLPLLPLSAEEGAVIERLGDILVVGGGKAGLAHFLSDQLKRPVAESLLMLRYLDVPPPHLDFYRSGLRAFDDSAKFLHGRSFTALSDEEAEALLRQAMTANPPGWSAEIPAPLFCFVLRADAIDVAYGTMEGFARLGIPYMGHIDPEAAW